ncbi:glycosyltransferase family 2 protein [Krasilnikovia sp. MM14-A1259]|uniref:glycosyltransferase family 2 protein n=1 Tax=Krasilnikovia sp. MM14-A1259 TaxID=3373539 RepID=UPI00381249C1
MPSSRPPLMPRDPVSSPTVSVVIPVLNEEENLPLVLEGLPPVDQVIVVDGGSTDDTVALAREVRPDAVLVRQTRAGKGNALACGFAAATGDIVVTLNGDGSADPGELPRFVDALLSGAQVAHGSRYRHGGGQLGGSRLERLADRLLCGLVNPVFGTRFTDLGYGYNAYWRAVLPAFGLPEPTVPGLRRGDQPWGDGPEIAPLLTLRTGTAGLRVVEVASIGYPRIHGAWQRRALRGLSRALRAACLELRHRRRVGPAAADRWPDGRAGQAGRGAADGWADGREAVPGGPGGGPTRQDRRSGARHAAEPVAQRSTARRLRSDGHAEPGQVPGARDWRTRRDGSRHQRATPGARNPG